MKRLEVVRHIAADPASVALLLADPTGDDERSDTRLRAADGEALEVSAPRRSGIGFSADVLVRVREGGSAPGEIRVEPATDAGCDARIVLHVPAGASTASVERQAGRFLSGLADRAKSRSFAA